jgi:hypothetical protein
MAVQNLISAAIPAETKTDVMQKLADVKKKLSFLLTLQGDEIQGLFKAGTGYAPFLEKAYNAANSHPEILPGVFNKEEFNKDYQLSKDLTAIVNMVNELADSLQNTLIAVNSDAMAEALDVYSAVKLNRDKVPGLNIIADEMAEFFKRTRKKTETAAK